GPADRQQRVGEIELPRLAHLADRDRRDRHREGAGDQAAARAERLDRLADEGDQRGTEQIEEGRAGRDQRGRPAVLLVQLGDIDALAVEAETPAEGRQQEADGDDAPAFVTERGFVSSRG
ncbi:hypothetical protein chiPu_0033561, partial [Chiloscyllium punctatum]|nr:hypothetical protein [Chiloscyllium punctatum]